jgi:type I restriction enzyme S subunit
VLKHRGVIPYSEKGRIGNKASDDIGRYKIVRPDDLVVNCMNVIIGSLGRSRYTGCLSPVYYVLRRRDLKHDPRYLELLFQHKSFHESLIRIGNGILAHRMRIPMEKLKSEVLPLPPPAEQAAIVRFLDWANGRLERAIRAKRKVIALLNEQKQAIIHRAVTRGLDPSVPLKDSGVPWLGEIPKHWEVRRLRHLIQGRLTYGANAAAEFTNQEWPRYIRITDFRTDGTLKTETFRSLPPAIAADYMVQPGDILLARSGATVGKAFLVKALTGPACHAGYLIRARPDLNLVLPDFLFGFTQSKAFAAWKDSTFNTATIQNIGADKYANLSLPLPPLPEQIALLDFLTNEQRHLVAAITRLEREITLLREYRTRLVSDVVTGKLDVRAAAAALPDEAPLDDATASADPDDDALDSDDLTDTEADASAPTPAKRASKP